MERPPLPAPGLVPFHDELNLVLKDLRDSADTAGERLTTAEGTLVTQESAIAANTSAVTTLGLVDQGKRRPVLNMAYIGDSITEYSDRYQNYAQIWSSGQLRTQFSAAYSGQSADQIAAHIDAITTLDPKPDACVIVAGTNNAYNEFALSTYQYGITTMVEALRAAGIVPVLCTVPPVATKSAWVNLYNQWVQRYAADELLILVDLNVRLVDPSTGDYATGLVVGDGVHPSGQGLSVIGRAIWETLRPMLTETPVSRVQRTQGAPNGFGTVSGGNSFLLVDSTADGRADVFTSGSGTGITLTLDPDPDGGGFNWQQIVVSGASGAVTMNNATSLLSGLTGWNVGDILEVSLLVDFEQLESDSSFVVGFGCRNSSDFVAGSYRNIVILHGDVVGMVSARFTLLPTTTGFRFVFQYGPGDGTYRIALPTIQNLTLLGLA